MFWGLRTRASWRLGRCSSLRTAVARAQSHSRSRCPVTDCPYAETKEQLAGFFILEAKHLHAIQLMSKHPAVRGGAMEIRPAADPTEMNREREQIGRAHV